MAARTRSRVAGRTTRGVCMTRDTVAVETPARRATSTIVIFPMAISENGVNVE